MRLIPLLVAALPLAPALAQPASPTLAQPASPTLAQRLVQETLADHPELSALTLHVDQPGGANVVAASNVAPLGKLADGDDEQVRRSLAPISGVNPAGTRFGVAAPLHDRAGSVIGTVNVGFPYHPNDETGGLVAHAQSVLGTLETRIACAAALFRPLAAEPACNR